MYIYIYIHIHMQIHLCSHAPVFAKVVIVMDVGHYRARPGTENRNRWSLWGR